LNMIVSSAKSNWTKWSVASQKHLSATKNSIFFTEKIEGGVYSSICCFISCKLIYIVEKQGVLIDIIAKIVISDCSSEFAMAP
jgi:hypothetical protein